MFLLDFLLITFFGVVAGLEARFGKWYRFWQIPTFIIADIVEHEPVRASTPQQIPTKVSRPQF
jgi:hypothetical protein